MLDYGKTELAAMEAVLDADHETVGDAAKAALLAAEDVFAKRAKFVVVGQLVHSKARGALSPRDPEAVKVALGWYSTEGKARQAAESMWHSTASGDTFRCWVLPVHHGTAADFHAERKRQYVAIEEKAEAAQRQRFLASIEKRQQAMEERAAGGRGSCEACSHAPYEHVSDGSSRGKCGLTDCPCPGWSEKRK